MLTYTSPPSALSGFVAALCIMQFTYTFPPLLMLGFSIQRDAAATAIPTNNQTGQTEAAGFDPVTGLTARSDSGAKRWLRGFLAGRWYVKVFNLVLGVGALVTAGLGMYSSIEGIMDAFEGGRNTAFSCVGPV